MVPRRPLVAIAGGIGFLLVLVGLTVMVGWLRHWPWAVKLGSDRLLIVFATGVNLTLLGAGLAALLVGTVRPNVRWADPVARGLGGVVALAQALADSRSAVGKVDYGTEAGLFTHAGIPTVVCGPGNIEQAHKPNEYIELAQIAQCEAFMRRLAQRQPQLQPA